MQWQAWSAQSVLRLNPLPVSELESHLTTNTLLETNDFRFIILLIVIVWRTWRCISQHAELLLDFDIAALGLTLDGMYKSLNRTVLYQLSRPVNSLADQTNILEALHKLTNNRSLILGPGNFDQEFIGCLCYCLLQLTGHNTISNIR